MLIKCAGSDPDNSSIRAGERVGKREPQHLIALCWGVASKELVEARDQIHLRDQKIDRDLDGTRRLQLVQALAQCAQVGRKRFVRKLHQGFKAQREQHPVQGLPRPILLEQREKLLPLGWIVLFVAALSDVATRRINQHGAIGEPPIAMASAAGDALSGRFSKLTGHWEVQTGVQQGRRFA